MDSESKPGWDLYHNVLGSPKYVVAPMVEQSELVRLSDKASLTQLIHVKAWRILSRRYGAQVHLFNLSFSNANFQRNWIL
jgi:tRNA-dihydrouridine synthase 1